MTHPNEEQLIAYHYGDVSEIQERAAIERHLVTCDGCHTSYQALQRVLAAVEAAPVPERDASYGSRVWQRIGPQLDQRERFDWRAWLVPRRWVAVGAMAALVFAAFLAGRFWPRPTQQESAGPIPVQVRERILLVAVGDHLDHAQMVLGTGQCGSNRNVDEGRGGHFLRAAAGAGPGGSQPALPADRRAHG